MVAEENTKKYQTPWRIPNVPTSKHTYMQASHAIAFKILGATHLSCMTAPPHMCVSGKRMKGGVILHTEFFSNLFSNKSVMNKNVNYFFCFLTPWWFGAYPPNTTKENKFIILKNMVCGSRRAGICCASNHAWLKMYAKKIFHSRILIVKLKGSNLKINTKLEYSTISFI